MKMDLRIWNKNTFEDINKTKDNLVTSIRELDKRDEEDNLDQENRELWIKLFLTYID